MTNKLTDPLTVGGAAAVALKGDFDASGGSFPVSPTNGDTYRVSVAGTVSGIALRVGDLIVWVATASAWWTGPGITTGVAPILVSAITNAAYATAENESLAITQDAPNGATYLRFKDSAGNVKSVQLA